MLTIPLIALGIVVAWLVLRAVMRRRAEAHRWRVVTRTLDDGRRLVVLVAPGGGERVIRELPAALDGAALESELRDARSLAFSEALRLNEPVAGRAPVARTRW
jgi:hypothetical protein